MSKIYFPKAMRVAPGLDPDFRPETIKRRYALLINPFYPKDPRASFGKHVLTPSLALTSIAASTPSCWAVKYWDENTLQGPPPREPFPEVVGITVHLTFAKRAFELARWYRERGAKVVLGGMHVQSCPEECAPHADALAFGEGVQLWRTILRDVQHGRLLSRYEGSYKVCCNSAPRPRRNLVAKRDFFTTSSMIATRGCHNRCGFCYMSTKGLRMPRMARDVGSVADEFKADGQPYGVFIDNNLGSDPDYLRRLCRALRPLEKIWSAAVSIEVTADPSLVREMALAGCIGVFVGFESLTAGNLDDSHKKGPRPKEYARRVQVFRDSGIQVNGSFVLGFDNDGPDVFRKTVEWIEENRLECSTFHILTPYPGTPLFESMEREGRLLHKDWSLYDTSNVVFLPKHMTAEELLAGYRWCYERLFSHRSIIRRRPEDTMAMLSYMAMSYFYKRSNMMWHFLIRHRLTGTVWRPMMELMRRRHLRLRKQLEISGEVSRWVAPSVVAAGV